MSISPLAHVDPGARIGKGVIIEPFSCVAADVEIGPETWVGPHVTIMDGARIGSNCKVFPGAVISAIPQDLKFHGEYTTVEIGDYNTIRECVTVNRGTDARGKTVIGDRNLLMAYSHVAHDCVLRNSIILGNATQLAGEVEVDDFAILSGACLVHQFCRIGSHVMIQGGSRLTKDVPPFVLAGREPIAYMGLNLVGLRRRGFSAEMLQNIQEAYRILYRNGLNVTQALAQIEEEALPSPEIETITSFVKGSSRGLIRGSKS